MKPLDTIDPDHTAILNRFATFAVSDEQSLAMSEARRGFRWMAVNIIASTKPGREQNLALNALEEAKYWTNQSIAKDGYSLGEFERLTQLLQVNEWEDEA
jgi:hypothetical protein